MRRAVAWRVFTVTALWLTAFGCSSTSQKSKDVIVNSGGDGGGGGSGAVGGTEAGSQNGSGGASTGGVSGDATGGVGTGATGGGTAGNGLAGIGSGADGSGGSGTSGGSGGDGGVPCTDPIPNVGLRCDSGDVYHVDSCGQLGGVAQDCCRGCQNSLCVAEGFTCSNGDIYSSDDCVTPNEKVQECGAGGCSDGRCLCVFADPDLEAAVYNRLFMPPEPLTSDDVGIIIQFAPPAGMIDNWSGIECLTSIETLTLTSQPPASLEPIAALNNLSFFIANDTTFADPSDFSLLVNTTTMRVRNASLTDIGVFTGLPLTELDLWYNNITSIAPLRQMTTLQRLNLRNNPITDLSPLLDIPALTNLYLEGTNIDCTAQATILAELDALHGAVFSDCS